MNIYRKNIIEQLLDTLNPRFLEVIDQSHLHIGHAGNDSDGKDSHYLIKISSDKFDSINRISAHRIINNLLKEEFENGLHAVSIKIIKK